MDAYGYVHLWMNDNADLNMRLKQGKQKSDKTYKTFNLKYKN